MESVWIVDQGRVRKDTDQVSCPDNTRELRGAWPPGGQYLQVLTRGEFFWILEGIGENLEIFSF